jgi:hypothetical protein
VQSATRIQQDAGAQKVGRKHGSAQVCAVSSRELDRGAYFLPCSHPVKHLRGIAIEAGKIRPPKRKSKHIHDGTGPGCARWKGELIRQLRWLARSTRVYVLSKRAGEQARGRRYSHYHGIFRVADCSFPSSHSAMSVHSELADWKTRAIIEIYLASSSSSSESVSTRNTRAVRSSLAVMMRRPSGANTALCTLPVWP